MRSVFNYKTKEEFASEKAEFESYLYYLKQTDPENYEEWFDEEVYKLFTEGRMNPRFLSERFLW